MYLIFFPFLIQVDVEETLSGKEKYYSSMESIIPEKAEKILTDTEEKIAEKDVFNGENSNQQTKHKEDSHHEHHNIDPSIEVKGYMTLSEVTSKYNIPVDYLKRKLKLPSSVSGSNQLGHLRKQYGFKMSEIETVIDSNQKSKNHEKDN